ncbi:hypothetical protein DFH09DRAFT_876124, partial [Mycena vulgaris]
MSGTGSFILSLFPTKHADAVEEKPAPAEEPKEEGPTAEEEPEDVHPAIRAEYEARRDCAPMKHDFKKCQEKMQAGKGFKGEECVEEL